MQVSTLSLHEVHRLYKNLQDERQLPPPCVIICSLYNQDTLVKCFLSASSCGHNSALCKQMKSPRPLCMEVIQVSLTDACCESPERGSC